MAQVCKKVNFRIGIGIPMILSYGTPPYRISLISEMCYVYRRTRLVWFLASYFSGVFWQ